VIARHGPQAAVGVIGPPRGAIVDRLAARSLRPPIDADDRWMDCPRLGREVVNEAVPPENPTLCGRRVPRSWCDRSCRSGPPDQ